MKSLNCCSCSSGVSHIDLPYDIEGIAIRMLSLETHSPKCPDADFLTWDINIEMERKGVQLESIIKKAKELRRA